MRSKLGIVMIAIGGCTAASTDGAASTAKSDATPAPAAPASAIAPDTAPAKAPPDGASTKAAAQPTPSVAAPVPAPAKVGDARELWVVAQRVGAVAIGELVDGTVVVVAPRDVAVAPPGAPLGAAKPLTAIVDGRGIELDAMQIERIGGRWPDDVWLVEVDYDMRDGTTWHLRELDEKGWQRRDETIDGVMVAVMDSFSPWQGGTTLARRRWRADETDEPSDNGWDDDPGGYERAQAKYERRLKKAVAKAKPAFVVLGGTALAPPAQLAAAKGEFLSLATGDAYVGCDPTGAFTHRNPNGEERSVPMPALANPGTQLESALLVGRTPDELYCVRSSAATTIVRFDGKAWHDVPAPAGDQPVRAASKAPGGPLFILLGPDPTVMTEGMVPGNSLLRLGDDGEWENVALDSVHAPAGTTIADIDPTSLVARGPDDLWIAGLVPPAQEGDELRRANWVVLHSRAPTSVLTLTAETD